MKVYIDLEQTVIESWDRIKAVPKACAQIRKFCKEYNVSEVSIFSYAIYDETDKEEFRTNGITNLIESELGVKCDPYAPSIEDFQKAAERYFFHKVPRSEFFPYVKKHIMFPIWIDEVHQNNPEHSEYILFDDMVHNTIIHTGRYNIRMIAV